MSPEDSALYAALYAERNLQAPRRELTRAGRTAQRAEAHSPITNDTKASA